MVSINPNPLDERSYIIRVGKYSIVTIPTFGQVLTPKDLVAIINNAIRSYERVKNNQS